MTLKILKEHYTVLEHRVANQYCISEKEPSTTGRSVHKYLCLLTKVGTKFSVENNEPTNDIDLIKAQVEAHVKSLPYDSDYYNPMYIKGYGEYLIIYDYLCSLGFKQSYGSGFGGVLDMIYSQKDIYGGVQEIVIGIEGLDPHHYSEEIKVLRYNGEHSWVSSKTDRCVENIKNKIDSILKPLLLANAVAAITFADKLSDAFSDVTLSEVKGWNVKQTKFDLKAKLQALIDNF